jgi:hypothetical protein
MSAAKVFDYSQNGLTGDVSGTNCAPAYPGFSFNGTDDYIDINTGPTSVSTVAMWIKPDSIIATTDGLIDLNTTDYLTVVNGTLTKAGFAGGTTVLYVDGVAGTSVTTNWHLIGITDTVAKNADDMEIGSLTGVATYMAGKIGETWLFSDVKGVDYMKSLYELTKWRYPNN